MSDVSQGEGWWEASDGKWYPPEAVPGADPDLTRRWDVDPSTGGPSSGGPTPFEPPSPGVPTPGQPGVAPGMPGAPGGPPPGYGAPAGGPSFGAPGPGPGIAPGSPPSYGSPGYGPPGAPAPGFGAPPPGAAPGAPPGYGAPSPAYGAPGPVGYGAPPKKSNQTVWIILGSIVGAFVLLCGGCVAIVALTGEATDGFGVPEVITEAGYDFSNAVPALGPASCEVTGVQSDGSDDYAVDAIVTSQADVRSHFRVDYELVDDSGESIGSDFGIISDVDPGETVRDSTYGLVDGTPDWTNVTCNVTSSVRIPS